MHASANMANLDWKLSKNVELRVMLENMKTEREETEDVSSSCGQEDCTDDMAMAAKDKFRNNTEFRQFREDLYKLVSDCEPDCEVCLNFVNVLSQHVTTVHKGSNNNQIRPTKTKTHDKRRMKIVKAKSNLQNDSPTSSSAKFDNELADDSNLSYCFEQEYSDVEMAIEKPDSLSFVFCQRKFPKALELNAHVLEHSEDVNDLPTSKTLDIESTEKKSKSQRKRKVTRRSQRKVKVKKRKRCPDPDPDPDPLGDNETKCEICSLTLKPDMSLEYHRKYFCKGKICKICNTIFASSSELNSHFKTHLQTGIATTEENLAETFEKCNENEQNPNNMTISVPILKPYECNECKDCFLNSMELKKHFQTKHPNLYPFRCDECEKGFLVKSKLVTHKIKYHGEKKFQCNKCGKEFPILEALETHSETHGELIEINCPTCGKVFRSHDNLQAHLRVHAGQDPYSCKHCNKAFKLRCNLHSHLLRCKGKDQDIPEVKVKFKISDEVNNGNARREVYACNICTNTFSNENGLTKHLRRTHGDLIPKPFECSYCDSKFLTVTKLNRHVVQAHPNKNLHECKICHKSYPSNYRLTAHMRSHTGERPYKCTICPKSFAKVHIFTVHMRIHTRTQAHKCQFCEKSFNTASGLRIHERMHTGERPFMCEVCSKCFSSQVVLTTHSKIHSEEGGVKVKPHVCDQCGKSFLRKDQLTTHSFTHGEKQCLCQTCGKAFTLPIQLKYHVKKVHGVYT